MSFLERFSVLLAVKIYMFEVHGASVPASQAKIRDRQLSWFPNVFMYLAMVGSAFLGILFAISALFPISLAPQFKPQTAASFVPQPEWYFLWLYQVLKVSAFEGTGIHYALAGVTVFAIALVLLPILDRGIETDPAHRPVFVIVGIVAVAEVVALTVWGYLTPGRVIPNWEALTFTVGLALVIVVLSLITFRARRMFHRKISVKPREVSHGGTRNRHSPCKPNPFRASSARA